MKILSLDESDEKKRSTLFFKKAIYIKIYQHNKSENAYFVFNNRFLFKHICIILTRN